MHDIGFNIEQICNLLGLERANKQNKTRSFNVKCPLCDNKHFHLNINTDKNTWRCAKCGVGGGMLEMYVRFGMNEPIYTKKLGSKAIHEIKEQLNLGFEKNIKLTTQYYEDEKIGTDEELHKIYSALLKIPVLRLSSQHKKKLIERGFSLEDIIQNEYRSFPERIFLPKGKKITYEMFRGEKLDKICKDEPELKRLRRKNIISGLYIGAYLNKIMHLDLNGIPGFFTINERWCFNYMPGMIIPVRNCKGEIVNLQIRTDSGKLRYITNSSKGFENGTTGKTRVHFCKNNAKIDAETKVFLTEGPLKADVCLSMMKKLKKYKDCKIAFIAIMGVNATKKLDKVIDYLNSCGCTSVFNLLDMDKITNPYVALASKKLKNMFADKKIDFKVHFWDKDYAENLFDKQKAILSKNKISVSYPNNNIFYKVLFNTLALKKEKIELSDDFREWNDKTKGFDDFLKSRTI